MHIFHVREGGRLKLDKSSGKGTISHDSGPKGLNGTSAKPLEDSSTENHFVSGCISSRDIDTEEGRESNKEK